MEQNYPCDHQNLLGKLMEEGTLNPGLLDRLLGAYTIFEYGGGKCFRKHKGVSPTEYRRAYRSPKS